MPEIGFRGSVKIEQGFPATFLMGHLNGVSRFCPAAVKLSDYLPVRITTHNRQKKVSPRAARRRERHDASIAQDIRAELSPRGCPVLAGQTNGRRGCIES